MVTRVGTGLASGLDIQSMIEALIAAERTQADLLEEKVYDETEKYDSWTEVDTLVDTLRSKSKQLNSYTTWRQMSTSIVDADSSSENMLTATASNSASAGIYKVKCTNMAVAENYYGTAQTSSTTALNLSGSFTVSGQTITVSTTDTLTDIKNNINSETANMASDAKAKAYIVDNRLVIENDDTGSDSETGGPVALALAEVTNTPLASLGFDLTGATNHTSSENFSGSINDISVSGYQNTGITDFITGVTLNFTKEGASIETSLTVSNDTSTIKSLIDEFITAYNALMEDIEDKSTVTVGATSTGENSLIVKTGTLQGDFLTSSIQYKCRTLITNTNTDPAIMDLDFSNLYSIGIWTDGENNELSIIDSGKLDEALANNYDEVEDLFRDTSGGIIHEFDEYLYTLVDPVDGTITTKMSNLSESISDDQDEIYSIDLKLIDREADLYQHFALMENVTSEMQSQLAYLMSTIGESVQ